MSWIREAKAELSEVLPGWTVLGYVPERLNHKIIVLDADDPYISTGNAFGELQLNLTLRAVFKEAPNKTVTETADDLIADLYTAFYPLGWSISGVRLEMVEDSTNVFPSVVLNINNTYSIY